MAAVTCVLQDAQSSWKYYRYEIAEDAEDRLVFRWVGPVDWSGPADGVCPCYIVSGNPVPADIAMTLTGLGHPMAALDKLREMVHGD